MIDSQQASAFIGTAALKVRQPEIEHAPCYITACHNAGAVQMDSAEDPNATE